MARCAMSRNPFAAKNEDVGSLGSLKTRTGTTHLGLSRSALFRSPMGSIISLCGVDPDIPLKSIVAQVKGGAIERISQAGDLIVISFIDKHAAGHFYSYAKCGQFVVEGTVIIPQNPELSQRVRGSEYDKQIQHGARRTLKVSRAAYENANHRRLIHSRMNMAMLEKIFENLGPLLSVQPMFCQNEVAFEIAFRDLESAIRAKRLFDNQSSLFDILGGWTLAYCSDPAEQRGYMASN